MKILILGCGQVGSTIASNLAILPNNDLTIIDTNQQALQKISTKLDVQTINGNGALPSILAAAGAEDADLLLALTSSDETNMVACRMAHTLFNIPQRIARIRNSHFLDFNINNDTHQSTLDLFNITEFISPEQLVTEQITNLLEQPNALQVLKFADDKLKLIVIHAQSSDIFIDQKFIEINQQLSEQFSCKIFAIHRNNHFIQLNSKTVFIEGDEIFILSATAHVHEMMQQLRPNILRTKKIMIAGGGNIGYRVANRLESEFDIKIIELNETRAAWLSENLDHALVLQGSVTDESLLTSEYIDDIDVFCALTNDDENNIMSSILAKNLGAKRVMSIVNRSSYADLLEGNTIDIVISPHLITIGSVLAHVRLGHVVAVHPLRRGSAEAIEVIIHGDRKTSKLVGRAISQVKLPKGCYFAALVRGDDIIFHTDNLILADNDHLIFFISRRSIMREVEKLIQVNMDFFG